MPSVNTRTNAAYASFLAAEAEYLRASGWRPYVQGASLYWQRNGGTRLDTQSEAIAMQRHVDEDAER